ncbi:MAG: hypothetical protein K1X94_18160 [Sandaracinaceae bacterium]|nr:hypothetical protein [Sandaracinaceae bacterium]
MTRAVAVVVSLGLVIGAALVPVEARAVRAVVPEIARLVFDEGSVTRESGEDPGDLYRGLLVRLVPVRRAAFLSCYRMEERREPEVGDGEIVFEVRIPRRGPSTAAVRSTTLTRPRLVSCVTRLVSGAEFDPRPRAPVVFAVRLRYERIRGAEL